MYSDNIIYLNFTGQSLLQLIKRFTNVKAILHTNINIVAAHADEFRTVFHRDFARVIRKSRAMNEQRKSISKTFASQDQVRRVFTGVNRFSADRFVRVEWKLTFRSRLFVGTKLPMEFRTISNDVVFHSIYCVANNFLIINFGLLPAAVLRLGDGKCTKCIAMVETYSRFEVGCRKYNWLWRNIIYLFINLEEMCQRYQR